MPNAFRHRQSLNEARSGGGEAGARAVCTCGYRTDLVAPDLPALRRNATALHAAHVAAVRANEEAGLITAGTGGAGTIDGLAGSDWLPEAASDVAATSPPTFRDVLLRRITVGVVIALGVATAAYFLRGGTVDPPEVGECVGYDEEREVTVVECTSPDAVYVVSSRVDDSTDAGACAGDPASDLTMRLETDGDPVVLCLRDR